MMLNRTSSENKLARTWNVVKKAAFGVASLTAAAAITGGCLQRPVEPQDPRTNNVYIDQIQQTAVDKIDLLFMIDNSISMADKQAILRDAVPVLVNRLIAPNCVDPETQAPTGGTVNAEGICASGEPEFNAIKDIHIGLVTSSLGGHGGQVCSVVSENPTLDDKGHLLGSVRAGLPQYGTSGFLAWDPLGTKNSPPGEGDAATLIANFGDHVTQAGENGCGYEASLEAWYRFLIDPEPPQEVTQQGGVTVKTTDANGAVVVDQTIISQRAAFLRPDSLVAIVMLTDENDCSIIDENQGWLVGLQQLNGAPFQMPRATSACAANPNDACCRSCASDESGGAPSGCGALSADSECAKGSLMAAEDNLNLRCYDQKRRFGFNLLYGTKRYVDGLTAAEVPNAKGDGLLPNPLYVGSDGKAPRDKSLVFLAGIIGVPWQDVATPESLTDPRGLTYKTAEQLATPDGNGTVWDMILGDTDNGVMPTDPLMIETPDPRTGTHPLTMEPVGPATSTDPQENSINGHEQNVTKRDDLQYACIFPLNMERPCDGTNQNACDCNAEDVDRNRPLCQPAGGGAAGTTQYWAKAYPGTRHLKVLKDFGPNAIVASICPKNVTAEGGPASDPNYGYNPAVGAIISRLKEALTGKCLPRTLVPQCGSRDESLPACDGNNCPNCYHPDAGEVPCAVVEAVFDDGAGCAACDALPGRSDVKAEIVPAVKENLANTGQCGTGAGQQSCDALCLCELKQLTDAQLNTCQNELTVTDTSVVGYCYVDEAQGIGNPELVAKCSATNKRILRFVDPSGNTPQRGAVTFIACLGATLGQQPAVEEMP